MHPPKALARAISEAAEEFGIPESILLAWSWAETGWGTDAYLYFPNLDRLEVAGKPMTWSSHPEWLTEGPTCRDLFAVGGDRVGKQVKGVDYGFVAQTRIAAGYGPFLLRYPVALLRGYTDDPNGLRTIESARWAAQVIRAGVEDGESVGRRGDDALAFGLMCVGGQVPSRTRVLAVETAHRTLFGRGYWE